jgi:xanthine dehydrogenase small subunit
MANYFQPDNLEEALALKAASPLTVLAGGTDIYPTKVTREASGSRIDQDILDISRIASLRGIEKTDGAWRIGALATWTDIAEASLPSLFDGLKLAAIEIGGRQIQNRGTVAGNICNASPAADGIPCLAAMDATIEICGKDGPRTVPILDFIDGYRRTVLAEDELVTAILIPEKSDATHSHFLKLGARRYLVISITMAACVIVPDDTGNIASAAISVGACSEKAVRLDALEAALVGKPLTSDLGNLVAASQFDKLSPIDDIRASGEYRHAAAIQVVIELLHQVSNGDVKRIAS